jgi:hypothetical protein
VRSSPGSAAWWKAGWTRNVVRQCVAAGGAQVHLGQHRVSLGGAARSHGSIPVWYGCVEAGPVQWGGDVFAERMYLENDSVFLGSMDGGVAREPCSSRLCFDPAHLDCHVDGGFRGLPRYASLLSTPRAPSPFGALLR